jgi:hypothetical protein
MTFTGMSDLFSQFLYKNLMKLTLGSQDQFVILLFIELLRNVLEKKIPDQKMTWINIQEIIHALVIGFKNHRAGKWTTCTISDTEAECEAAEKQSYNNLFSYIREEIFDNPYVVLLINITVRLVQEMEVLEGRNCESLYHETYATQTGSRVWRCPANHSKMKGKTTDVSQ